MKKLKIIFALTISASLAVLLTSGCASHSKDATGIIESQHVIAVQEETASYTQAPELVDIVGSVEPVLDVDISTRASERVTKVLVNVGDHVSDGQTVVLLDSRDVDSAVNQADADLSAATSAYSAAQSSEQMVKQTSDAQISAAADDVQEAEATLAASIAHKQMVDAGPRPEERDQSVQNTVRSKSTYTLAENNYNRMTKLFAEDAITAQQLDESKSAVDSAAAELQSAQLAQDMAVEGSRVEDKNSAKDALDAAEAGLAQAKANLAAAKATSLSAKVQSEKVSGALASMIKAKAGIEEASSNQSYTNITAPFAGVITARNVEEGAMAGSGVSLLHEQGDALEVEAEAPESAVGYIHDGQRLNISIGALGEKIYHAVVVSIDPQGNPSSHTYLLKAILDTADGVESGMYAKAEIATGTTNQLLAPRAAIVNRDGLSYLYVVQNGLAKMRMVSLGEQFGGLVSIDAGVQPGEVIVVSDVDRLSDNSNVTEKQ